MAEFSVISWVNDHKCYDECVAPSFLYDYQAGLHTVELVIVGKDAGCRNLGEAYNKALERASFANKIYMHQDVRIWDRTFLNKLEILLSLPYMGAVGIIGCKEHTGGLYSHGTYDQRMGELSAQGEWGFWPECGQVAVVDALLMATKSSRKWDTRYQIIHMFVEDYTSQLIFLDGLQVWTVDSLIEHRGGAGETDQTYWLSVEQYRRRWKKYLPPVPPKAKLKAGVQEAKDLIKKITPEALKQGLNPMLLSKKEREALGMGLMGVPPALLKR